MTNRLFILLFLLACDRPQTDTDKKASSYIVSVNTADSNQRNFQNAGSSDTTSVIGEGSKSLVSKTKSIQPGSFNLENALLKKGIYFGTAISDHDIYLNPPRPAGYLDQISKYFNFYTMNVSFNVVESKRGVFNFTTPDKIVEFAIAHKAKVKAHALVMGSPLPPWLTKGKFSPNELKAILKTHVQTIVKHYRDKYPGTVIEYNVVNEPFCNGRQMSDTNTCFTDVGIAKNIWTGIRKPGSIDPTDYMQLAFQWAKETDPQAKFYLNENNLELNSPKKIDNAYKVIKAWKEKSVPIDGIGFQCHLKLHQSNQYSYSGFKNTLNRFASLGLETQVTEFDVMLTSGGKNGVLFAINDPTTGDLQKQAELYKMFLQACLNAKNFKAFSMWGCWDGDSWANLHWKGNFQPHILNDKLQPKATYKALVDAAKNPNSSE